MASNSRTAFTTGAEASSKVPQPFTNPIIFRPKEISEAFRSVIQILCAMTYISNRSLILLTISQASELQEARKNQAKPCKVTNTKWVAYNPPVPYSLAMESKKRLTIKSREQLWVHIAIDFPLSVRPDRQTAR